MRLRSVVKSNSHLRGLDLLVTTGTLLISALNLLHSRWIIEFVGREFCPKTASAPPLAFSPQPSSNLSAVTCCRGVMAACSEWPFPCAACTRNDCQQRRSKPRFMLGTSSEIIAIWNPLFLFRVHSVTSTGSTYLADLGACKSTTFHCQTHHGALRIRQFMPPTVRESNMPLWRITIACKMNNHGCRYFVP